MKYRITEMCPAPGTPCIPCANRGTANMYQDLAQHGVLEDKDWGRPSFDAPFHVVKVYVC